MPQHYNWVELLQCSGLEMVVWVVEWGCIFERDVDGVVVGQVVSHYILAEPAYYLGLGFVEKEAMVAVEQVVEAKEQEESCTGASTLDEVNSTEVVAEHRGELDE